MPTKKPAKSSSKKKDKPTPEQQGQLVLFDLKVWKDMTPEESRRAEDYQAQRRTKPTWQAAYKSWAEQYEKCAEMNRERGNVERAAWYDEYARRWWQHYRDAVAKGI